MCWVGRGNVCLVLGVLVGVSDCSKAHHSMSPTGPPPDPPPPPTHTQSCVLRCIPCIIIIRDKILDPPYDTIQGSAPCFFLTSTHRLRSAQPHGPQAEKKREGALHESLALYTPFILVDLVSFCSSDELALFTNNIKLKFL